MQNINILIHLQQFHFMDLMDALKNDDDLRR